jgi:Rrf2 family protein
MRSDNRLSLALHVLLHMSEHDGPASSEQLGPRLGVNAVVLRRTLAGLRDAGIVSSVKGHGGGWSIARDLSEVTLGDVHRAIGSSALFGIGHRDEETACPIEQAVNRTITGALHAASEVFESALQGVAVADLLEGGRKKFRQHAGDPSHA